MVGGKEGGSFRGIGKRLIFPLGEIFQSLKENGCEREAAGRERKHTVLIRIYNHGLITSPSMLRRRGFINRNSVMSRSGLVARSRIITS